MTDEQYIELTEYETQLRSAAYSNFCRFITLEKKKRLSELYAAVFNKKSNMMNGCGTCALREMKELGLLYFKVKEIKDRKGLEPDNTNTTETEVVKTIKTTKRSQKKKEE